MHKCTTEVSRLKAVMERAMAGVWRWWCAGGVGRGRGEDMCLGGEGRGREKERDLNLFFEMRSFPLGQ